MDVARWWRKRPDVERFDLSTRAPLYLVSAAEPVAVVLLLVEQESLRRWGVVALLVVTVAHTIACLAVLHAGLAARLGGQPPRTRLIGLALGLTLGGLAVGPVAIPAYGRLLGENGFPVGLAVTLVFCAGLTVALTPLLGGLRLAVVLVGPAVVLAVVQAVAVTTPQTPWALNYLLVAGALVLMYRSSSWVLGVVWELERARDVQARLAVAEERLRVSRDLHDVLGRNLTLIAVNSELAAQLVHRSADEAAARMLDVRRVAQDSMREVREVVGGQRTTDLDAELAGARSVLRSAGIDVRVIGDSAGLPGEVQAVLGWAVREATTNILRHAEPTRVTIDLDTGPGVGSQTRLRIENDGVPAPGSRPASEGHGTGLVGLRERLARAGGDLTAEVLPDGRFRVEARLPLTRRPASALELTEPAP